MGKCQKCGAESDWLHYRKGMELCSACREEFDKNRVKKEYYEELKRKLDE
jgi:hypothetical protein